VKAFRGKNLNNIQHKSLDRFKPLGEFFSAADNDLVAGRPDWANFRLLGDYFLWAVFRK
jgi:hypothetical protein